MLSPLRQAQRVAQTQATVHQETASSAEPVEAEHDEEQGHVNGLRVLNSVGL